MKRLLQNPLFIVLLFCSFNALSQVKYFASNRVNNAINLYDENGNYIEEFITANSGGLNSPQDIVLHSDGFLLVTGFNNTRILKFDATNGDFIEFWSDATFALSNPSKMSIGPDNNIYVTQWGQTLEGSRVVRFNSEGDYLGGFTPSAPKSLGHLWDSNGDFYLALFGLAPGSGTINKYDANGNSLGTFIDTLILQSPSYFWFDENQNMFVQDFSAGKVLKYDSNGQYIEDYITGLANPEGFVFLPNGELLISERGNNQISKFSTTGVFLGRWDNGGVLEGPNFVKALDYSILGIQEEEHNIVNIFPTMGSKFHIEVDTNIKNIKIYTLLGKLIHKNNHISNTLWDATTAKEGIYIAKIVTGNGTTYCQKLIVKK